MNFVINQFQIVAIAQSGALNRIISGKFNDSLFGRIGSQECSDPGRSSSRCLLPNLFARITFARQRARIVVSEDSKRRASQEIIVSSP